MRKVATIVLVGLMITSNQGLCQKGIARTFDTPILTDTLSSLFIPIRYNERFLSVNKIAFWGDYYANIIVYNFNTDSYKKLFSKDTYIRAVRGDYSYATHDYDKIKNLSSKWVFLLVKPTDTNGNGRIDERDPTVLVCVSTDGQTVKQLTDETENVVSITSFERQGFVLVKIQKDMDNDKIFSNDDEEFYFKKVNLSDLAMGRAIDLKLNN